MHAHMIKWMTEEDQLFWHAATLNQHNRIRRWTRVSTVELRIESTTNISEITNHPWNYTFVIWIRSNGNGRWKNYGRCLSCRLFSLALAVECNLFDSAMRSFCFFSRSIFAFKSCNCADVVAAAAAVRSFLLCVDSHDHDHSMFQRMAHQSNKSKANAAEKE